MMSVSMMCPFFLMVSWLCVTLSLHGIKFVSNTLSLLCAMCLCLCILHALLIDWNYFILDRNISKDNHNLSLVPLRGT